MKSRLPRIWQKDITNVCQRPTPPHQILSLLLRPPPLPSRGTCLNHGDYSTKPRKRELLRYFIKFSWWNATCDAHVSKNLTNQIWIKRLRELKSLVKFYRIGFRVRAAFLKVKSALSRSRARCTGQPKLKSEQKKPWIKWSAKEKAVNLNRAKICWRKSRSSLVILTNLYLRFPNKDWSIM